LRGRRSRPGRNGKKYKAAKKSEKRIGGERNRLDGGRHTTVAGVLETNRKPDPGKK